MTNHIIFDICKNTLPILLILSLASMSQCSKESSEDRKGMVMNETMQRLSGTSIAIDPAFQFYKAKSWDGWAEEIRKFNFSAVHIIIVAPISIAEQKKIVQAFHGCGIACALRIYPTTDFEAYEKHPEWRQKSLDGSSRHDWRVYLCPNAPGFTEHVCSRVMEMVGSVPYDAIELAEPWFEVWGGPYENNPNRGKYACLCDNCSHLFKEKTGTSPQDFLFNPQILKSSNSQVYKSWQDFRVETIIRFSARIYEAAQKARPGLKTIHMHLSDCTVEPEGSREYQAQDIDAALKTLKPDILIIEDAWQDWTKPDLKPEFVKAYAKAYVKRSRAIIPDLIIKAHADIGSRKEMRRTYSWMRRFTAEARAGGFNSACYYEFSIGDFTQ